GAERDQRRPLEAIEWVAGRMSLGYRCTAQMLAPIVVVALCTGQVELSLLAFEDFTADIDERAGFRIVGDRDRLSLRLMRDIGRQRQQLPALERQRRDLLLLRSASIDALLDINRSAERWIDGRIPRRDRFHAGA